MYKLFLIFSLFSLLTVGCNKVGDNDVHDFVCDKMQWLRIQPEVDTGDAEYSWLLDGDKIADTKDLFHVFAQAGVYILKFIAKTETAEATKTYSVKVNEKAYINDITRVFEYFPAPGQFINKIPEATVDDTPETMRQKAEDALAVGFMIGLGGFGGYVVFGFDHVVVNRHNADFTVLGNAITTWAEPGVIMVSFDSNGNGLPDDEWYEIAGSEYNKPTTIKNYEITYYKPETEPDNPNEPNYIRWTDNQGQTGFISKNAAHSQTYYPLWKADSYTLRGTLMETDIIDQSGNGSFLVSSPFEWGYADNWANNDSRAQIDIDWAVDKNGEPVKLKGIDFVKVYTAIRSEGGWMGEISTELTGFVDLNLVD